MGSSSAARSFPDHPSHDQRFRLDGRTAFVTGAAGHLGRAMSIALATAGAHVILNGRTASKLEAFSAELAAAGLKSSMAAFDIMDREAASGFLGGLDRLDVLINNAITGLPTKDDTSSGKAFRIALESGVAVAYENTVAAMSGLEAAVAATGQASVIHITSIYAHVSPSFSVYGDSGLNSPPQYSAAKGGLLQLTRYMACELAPRRIRVNSLSPGIFPWDQVPRDYPDFIERVCARTPMGRTGRADEIGGPAVFLASDASSFMTGADLRVDGGWVAW
ncbi:MAG TPA: SDR family oxidoreductase [Caulobacteraceae bacterium]|jgi:NAD(P)-dependent dehydrogenase (short-subunit alcohol dehydrogenase family)